MALDRGMVFPAAGGFFAGIVKFFVLFPCGRYVLQIHGAALLAQARRLGPPKRGWGHHHRWDRHGWGHHGDKPPWYGDESDEPVMKA